MTRGTQIISAIDKYQTVNHKLPDNLDTLTPDYIAHLPVTTDNKSFHYEIAYKGYILRFDGNNKDRGCWYNRYTDPASGTILNSWACDGE